MAAMEELGTELQSLQALKPPGVTPTKIKNITKICVDNIQSDQTIVQKILQQLQNSPNTHKLGVLYVVDSVARQWVEKAKQSGQKIGNAQQGTYAGGVQLIEKVLPVAMEDVVRAAPDNHKEKISKLLDIWERGHTFPKPMLSDFKQQLSGGQNNAYEPPKPPITNNVGQIYHGHTNTQPPAQPTTQPQSQDPAALFAALASLNQQGAPTNAPAVVPPALPFAQNMGMPPPPPGFAPPPPVAMPNVAPSAPGMNDLATQIIHALQAGTIDTDQAMQVLSALAQAQNGGLSLQTPQAQAVPQAQPQAHSGMQPNVQYENRIRDRSRSPDYQHRKSPDVLNRRQSPTYGVYDPNAASNGNMQGADGDRGRGRGKRGGRNDYRQRSPPRRQQSPSGNGYGQSTFLEWDDTLPRDHIKVLSRTLFVGGAGGSEGEIRSIFSRFGRVQTCIVNQDKRHAFVKMYTRPDAIAAKEGMDASQDAATLSKARQTRWGVGFGPRECSNYETGVSVIPITRLTDADRKWVLTAEHGGTGGRALESGMVIEEPDIEIGAGVSSKAISRRVPTDAPRGGRGGFGGRGGHAPQQNNAPPKFHNQHRPVNDPRHISPRPEQGVAVPPAVPGFGFQLPF